MDSLTLHRHAENSMHKKKVSEMIEKKYSPILLTFRIRSYKIDIPNDDSLKPFNFCWPY